MFRYRVRDDIRHTLAKYKKDPLAYNKRWEYVSSFVKSYSEREAMLSHILDVEFYSPSRVRQVPVNGFLFPVDMVKCEEV